ncbi:MAG: hypothetical protein ACP5I6_02655 [Caldisphaera sp.]|jgi:hypothetical protein|nr:hypothetical protein [Caldisphaera sp.]PMP60399.1 MAG: hypothetical protein C0201_03045 [Caldisphaera sp.]PMP88242.1 MAG: hypothetical protein C0172_03145 [Caldisphaera sp.]
MVLCSVCKKREAVYYRRYSGEALCAKCLNNSVEKDVKKEISKIKILNINSKIVIPITFFAPSSSIVLANMLSRIEKRFKSKIVILVPNVYNRSDIIGLLDKNDRSDIIGIKINNFNYDALKNISLQECIRFERAWSIKASKEIGYENIALPITRTDISLILVDSLLNGQRDFISETYDTLEFNGLNIFYPFASIEGETLSAYEIIAKIIVKPLCYPYIKSKSVFYSIGGNRPELDFGSEKIIQKFRSINANRCKICGGFSSKDVCKVCKKLNLENIDIEFLS